jgi:hypothetical protein
MRDKRFLFFLTYQNIVLNIKIIALTKNQRLGFFSFSSLTRLCTKESEIRNYQKNKRKKEKSLTLTHPNLGRKVGQPLLYKSTPIRLPKLVPFPIFKENIIKNIKNYPPADTLNLGFLVGKQ